MRRMVAGLYPALLAVGAMLLPECNARAQLDMPERESVQTVVWIVELTAFLLVLGIVWFVWRISRKESEKRKSERDDL